MAGIGADIAEVANELGTEVTILRTPTNIKEFIMYEVNLQSSRPFYREFMIEGSLIYNSVIEPGDIIQFGGRSYLVANKTPEMFENSVVEYAVVMFKCNFPVTSQILAPTKTQDPVTFAITAGWTVKEPTPYGLLFLGDWVTINNPETYTGKESTYKASALVPNTYNIEIGDRLYFDSLEYYRVQTIERYEYPGIFVLGMVEDDRVAYIP